MTDDNVIPIRRPRFMVRTDDTIYDTVNDVVLTVDDLCAWANNICRVVETHLREAQNDEAN